MTNEKFCFRYDGSDEAREAWDVWNKILPDFNYFIKPIQNRYYASTGGSGGERPNDYTLVTPAEFIRLMKGEEVKYPSALGSIDLSQKDGKRLMAALAIITTECRRDKTPDECIKEIDDLAYEMYKPKPKSLREELIEWAKKYESVLEAMPELLAIIDRHEKERGVEG